MDLERVVVRSIFGVRRTERCHPGSGQSAVYTSIHVDGGSPLELGGEGQGQHGDAVGRGGAWEAGTGSASSDHAGGGIGLAPSYSLRCNLLRQRRAPLPLLAVALLASQVAG